MVSWAFPHHSLNDTVLFDDSGCWLPANASLAEACQRFAGAIGDSLGVIDQGYMVGILTRDQLLRAIAAGVVPTQARVLDHMTTPVPTLTPDLTVEQVRSHFQRHPLPALPLVNAEGYPLGFIQRPEETAGQAAQVSELIGYQLVQQSPNPIFAVDRQGNLAIWNVAFAAWFQGNAPRLGDSLQEQLQPVIAGYSLEDVMAQVFAGATLNRVEITYRLPDGSLRMMLSRLYPIFGGPGDVGYCAFANTDITGLKAAETSLRLEEERFRTIFEQAPVGFCWADLQGRIQRANTWFCEFLGYSAAEMTQQTFQALTHPDDLARDLAANRALLCGEVETFTLEKRYQHRHGHALWVSLTVCTLRDSVGQVYGTLGIVQDIGDRKRTEAALQRSQERYTLATAESQVGVWDWDLTTDEIYISPNLKALLGWADAAVPHLSTWIEWVHPQDRDPVIAAMQAHLDGDTERYEMAHRMVHRDGRIYWLLARGTAIRDDQGRPLRLAGTYTDITQLKQTEDALRASHQQVTDILESITDGFFALDENWRFTYINQRAEQQLQQPRQTLLGQCLWTVLPSMAQTGCYEAFHQVMQERVSRVFEVFYGPLNAWFEMHAYPTPWGISVYFQDSTGRRRAYQQLQHQIQRERSLNRVIRLIRQSLDLDTIFSTAAREIGVLLNISHVSIVSYHPDADRWQVLERFTPAPAQTDGWVEQVLVHNTAITQRLRDRQTVCINNTESLAAAPAETATAAWLLVPLDTGHSHPWGSLSLMRQRDRGPWQPPEQELAEAIADQLAIAIQQADRYEQAQRELAERQRVEARLRAAQRLARLGNWELDVDSGQMSWSEELYYLFGGFSEKPPDSFDPMSLVHPEDRLLLQDTLRAAQVTGEPFELEFRVQADRSAPQTVRFVHLRGEATYRENGHIKALFGTLMDVTERRQFEDQLAYEAYHDSLTQAPNRAFFMDCLQAATQQAHLTPDYAFAVLFIDLDRFNVINDSLGHLAGDQLLVACVQRLLQVAQDSDAFARLGGDEFALLLDNIESLSAAIEAAESVHAAFQAPFLIAGREIFVTVSIGIASNLRGSLDPVDCLRDADIAMFHAKSRGRACHVLFNPEMHTQNTQRLILETDLQRAVERQELKLVYQPIVCLKTGQLSGFEALVRWHHPYFGLIQPTQFIPLAEETGVILSMGGWIRQQACRQLQEWQQRFPQAAPLTMSVNLSVKQFTSLQLLDQIDEALAQSGLAGQYLRLEITESALIDNPEMAETILQHLRSRGIELCIDDFGTGYSSLSMVHRYPLQVLKIDRSFISRLAADQRGVAMVKTILALADSLAMQAVAEGVETEAQLRILQQLGCQSAQGYFFAPPLSDEEAAALIAENAVWSVPIA